ncbi:MAG TPA: Calx-beta domain-containing protein [Methylomirabilota bacterium]|nr:Calx-beta domain-containing protein [Methylomirabilota bacterium]
MPYSTVDGTARAGVDYKPVSGTLVFNPGVFLVTIQVSVFANLIDDGDRSFTVALGQPYAIVHGAPTPAGSVGTPATGVIHNDDLGGTVQWSVVAFSATACPASATTNCSVTLTVKRFSGGAAGVSIDYATVDGTGNALHDYVPVTDTVVFGAAEFLKTVTIPVRPGSTRGSNFGVILSNPQGGAVLGPQSTATVTLN